MAGWVCSAHVLHPGVCPECSWAVSLANPSGTGAVTAERTHRFLHSFFSPFCALAASCTVTLPHALKCLVCVHASRSGCGCFSNTFRVHSATFHMSCKKRSWNPLARCLFNTVCLNRNFTGTVCCLCIKFYLAAHKIVV